MKNINPEEITSLLAKELERFGKPSKIEEVGQVLQIGDGVAHISGLHKAQIGELLLFPEGIEGLVLNLEKGNVGAVLLGSASQIKEGDIVKRTGRIGTIKVGEGMLGRVVNTLGHPIDGKGDLQGELVDMPLERKAPDLIYRSPVREPLYSGIKSVDSMLAIGRGQRELIAGDRNTGKTTIAIDAILSQMKEYKKGNPVYCIYVAIGQKASTVVEIVSLLKSRGALAYTTIVCANASEPASLQYLAPFTGVALGEYFRDTGRHALITYDDLSKQAIAFREVSLLLRRPPGREAYPGDIFFLHARLLERAAKITEEDSIAAKMNDLPSSLKGKVKGGGSLTALPIIETQEGDISAYIPTNVISITDGQIILNVDLFNSNIRPAIQIGESVSRVGGSAQTPLMKKLAGVLKLGQARFRDLEAFSKFGSDVDPITQKIIDRGRRGQKLLTQPPYNPFSLSHQLLLLYLIKNNKLDGVALEAVGRFQRELLYHMDENYLEVLSKLENSNKISPELEQQLESCINEILKNYI